MAEEEPKVFTIRVHGPDGRLVEGLFPIYKVDEDEAHAMRNYSLGACWGMDFTGEVWPLEADEEDGWDGYQDGF